MTSPRAGGAWPSRDILRATALVALVWLLLRLAWVIQSVLLLGFLGMLFGVGLAGIAAWLHARTGLPRPAGVLATVLVVLGAAGLGGWLLAPTVGSQAAELRAQLPAALDRGESWLQSRQHELAGVLGPSPADSASADTTSAQDTVATGAAAGRTSFDVRGGLAGQVRSLGQHFFGFLSSTLSVLSGLVLVLFVAIYVGVDPGVYERGLLHLVPHRDRDRVRTVLGETATTLRRWLVVQLIDMLVIGGLTTAALLVLGVPAAIPLGVLAGILEFIPLFGPVIALVPGVAMAFLVSPSTALYVLLAYLVIQQLESNVLTPLIMKQGLEIPPVLTLLVGTAMGLVFGFVGLLVAVPLLATVLVPVKLLYVRDVVGDDVSLPSG